MLRLTKTVHRIAVVQKSVKAAASDSVLTAFRLALTTDQILLLSSHKVTEQTIAVGPFNVTTSLVLLLAPFIAHYPCCSDSVKLA